MIHPHQPRCLHVSSFRMFQGRVPRARVPCRSQRRAGRREKGRMDRHIYIYIIRCIDMVFTHLVGEHRSSL